MKSAQKSKIKRAIKIIELLDQIKPLYKELDEITMGLVQENFTSARVKGKTVTLADNFADKNSVFKAVAIKRFELKVESTL